MKLLQMIAWFILGEMNSVMASNGSNLHDLFDVMRGTEVFFDIPQASAETLWAACETVRGGGIVCLVLPAQLTLKLVC